MWLEWSRGERERGRENVCVGGGGKQDMGVEEDWGLYPGWVGRHRRALCRGGMESDQVITEAL